MNEYFVNTTDSYIPTYKPGCAAYGQDGTNANTGETGSSVYYSSIDFSNIFTSDKSTLSKINSLIKSGKPLSNNLFYHFHFLIEYHYLRAAYKIL